MLDTATLAREGNFFFFLKQADFFVFALTGEANKRNQESDEKYVNHIFFPVSIFLLHYSNGGSVYLSASIPGKNAIAAVHMQTLVDCLKLNELNNDYVLLQKMSMLMYII